MSLAGLGDDYEHDGRVLFEEIDDNTLPIALRGHKPMLEAMASLYKQIDSPFGQLAMDSLVVSTRAVESNSPMDSTYLMLEGDIADWTETRDTIAANMKSLLDNAAFAGNKIKEPEAKSLISQAQSLLNTVHAAAQ